MSILSEGKFSLGAVEILSGAQKALTEAGQPAAAYLYQHQVEIPDHLVSADSLFSQFDLPTGVTLYVVTDEARMHTVMFTAEDVTPSSP